MSYSRLSALCVGRGELEACDEHVDRSGKGLWVEVLAENARLMVKSVPRWKHACTVSLTGHLMVVCVCMIFC